MQYRLYQALSPSTNSSATGLPSPYENPLNLSFRLLHYRAYRVSTAPLRVRLITLRLHWAMNVYISLTSIDILPSNLAHISTPQHIHAHAIRAAKTRRFPFPRAHNLHLHPSAYRFSDAECSPQGLHLHLLLRGGPVLQTRFKGVRRGDWFAFG